VRRLRIALALLTLVVPAARAHHRQTPAITPITTGGDATLPRLPPPSRKAIAFTVDTDVAVVQPFRNPGIPTFFFGAGTNANPSITSNGRTVAWDTDADPLASGAPGRQVVVDQKFTLAQPRVDPTGTSTNPAIDLVGTWVAFESTADFAGTGNPGARQVFLANQRGGTILQLSRGVGASRNPAVGRRGRRVVFDSTSHPATGADTGVAQIWSADPTTGASAPITDGLGASTSPSLSNDGRLVVFESRADLAGDGHDTGTPQVFAYDTTSRTFARITNEPGGCTRASSARIKRDWRIAYVCGGTAYFTMLRADARYEVETDGGDTTRIVPQADAHFMLVATTANLAGAGTTAGHRVYMVNLFARPPVPAAGDVVWFPFQGINPL
jgi:Tol biopolymer transport system component